MTLDFMGYYIVSIYRRERSHCSAFKDRLAAVPCRR